LWWVPKSEREMTEIMSLGKYVRKKKLEVNVEKTKMIVFNKRKTKSEQKEWKWKGRNVERVSEFKYLGYSFNKRATDKAHVREVVRKANKVVGCVWVIGERKWGGEFGRRIVIYTTREERKAFVHANCMYGHDAQRSGRCNQVNKSGLTL
jgi:hypothetical protein